MNMSDLFNSQLIGIIIGFLLAISTDLFKSFGNNKRLKKLLFKELLINYEQIILVIPKTAGENKTVTVHLDPFLIADVSESMHTILYAANAEKSFQFNLKVSESIVDAYRSISQFQRLSRILIANKSEINKGKNNAVLTAVPQSALIAFNKIEEALKNIDKKKAIKCISELSSKKGKFTFTEE